MNFNLPLAQEILQRENLDGWLIYDFRSSNPMIALIAGKKLWTTRRLYLLIPSKGEPILLVNRLDLPHTLDLPGKRIVYTDRFQLEEYLINDLLKGRSRIAMEYSPNGALPVVAIIDAGTVEFIKDKGVEVVSSADLTQVLLSAWDAAALEHHRRASTLVAGIKDEAFNRIGRLLHEGESPTEYDIQQFIFNRFTEEGLETDEPPVVATNAHAGDPHYLPTKDHSSIIRLGDWILIDLWARLPGEQNIFSDITWVGVAGREPSAREQLVFETVCAGRDEALRVLESAANDRKTLQGWEVDAAVRKVITDAGFGEYFFHRTGHSLSPGKYVHGTGVNIDDFETHDTRRILPGLGFTIEPGIYLPEFGVRLEINVYMTESGPEVTSPMQREIIRI